jgi:DNA-binding NarL/FixJ family response regulator
MMGKNKQTFLIVDDSTFIFNRLIDLLEDAQSFKKISTAHNFTEVAGMLEQKKPDAILLNLRSLDADEFGLLSILKDLYPQISIAILSKKYNKYYLNQWKKIGNGYFIEKLSDIEDVKEIIRLKKKHVNLFVV